MPSQVYVSRVWRLGEIVRWQDRIGVFQPGEGTGLGLSISWDIVTQRHGGTIGVDSREGEFTEFTIRLPRKGQAAGKNIADAVAGVR